MRARERVCVYARVHRRLHASTRARLEQDAAARPLERRDLPVGRDRCALRRRDRLEHVVHRRRRRRVRRHRRLRSDREDRAQPRRRLRGCWRCRRRGYGYGGGRRGDGLGRFCATGCGGRRPVFSDGRWHARASAQSRGRGLARGVLFGLKAKRRAARLDQLAE